jgi:hypothetical protein
MEQYKRVPVEVNYAYYRLWKTNSYYVMKIVSNDTRCGICETIPAVLAVSAF